LEEQEIKMEDLDLPDFEVVDNGIEVQEKEEDSEKSVEERSVSSEVVKEVVHDQVHLTRLTELDSIAQQIKALESMMAEEKIVKTEEEYSGSQRQRKGPLEPYPLAYGPNGNINYLFSNLLILHKKERSH
jgi:hypothetical protein